jgi:hypothetical protein
MGQDQVRASRSLRMIDDSSWPRLVRYDRGVILIAWRAGATAGVICSLCRPGTYLTGSGEGAQRRLRPESCTRGVLARPYQLPCQV